MLKLIHNIFTNKSVQSGGIFAFFSFLNQGLNFFPTDNIITLYFASFLW